MFNSPILEISNNQKTEAAVPVQRRMNQRGALRADGMQEFNPDAGVKLSRKSEAIAA
jgi:hypothetical protein